MGAWITGLGTAVPTHRISQRDAATIAKPFTCTIPPQERLFDTIYERSHVETRYSVLLANSDGPLETRQAFYQREDGKIFSAPSTERRMQEFEAAAGRLAGQAVAAALADASVAAKQITSLVSVTCTGFFSPGVDIQLIKQLGMRRDVKRTQVGFMGCHGALNGLRVMQAILQADSTACVAMCAVELCSLHHQYEWDIEQIIANALFADGAAAVIGRSDQQRADDYQLVTVDSCLVDDTEEAMSWRIGNQGFTMTLSSRVPNLIRQNVRPWLDQWLSRYDLTISQVGCWAVHPGGPQILAAFAQATDLDRTALAASYQVLARYGNMSSPTVLFVLDALRQARAARPCVMLAFGPGLTVEAALLR